MLGGLKLASKLAKQWLFPANMSIHKIISVILLLQKIKHHETNIHKKYFTEKNCMDKSFFQNILPTQKYKKKTWKKSVFLVFFKEQNKQKWSPY